MDLPTVGPRPDESIVQSATLADQVYAILSRRLLMGAWGPRVRIAPTALAQDLCVSITPVREAMARLVNEGALVNADGRGFWTVQFDRETFQEMTRIRLALEPMATELATANMTETDIAALGHLNETLMEAITREDFSAALQIDTTFHMEIYERARQPLLNAMITALLRRASPTRTRLSGRYRKTLVGLGHHRRILDAFRAGDAEAARTELAHDIQDGSVAILAELLT